jgi:hypothetical protein
LRRLHHEEHYLYSPNFIQPIKSRSIRWAGSAARIGEKCVCNVLVGKPEGKGTLGRPWRRWEGKLKTRYSRRGIGGVVDGTDLAQGREGE